MLSVSPVYDSNGFHGVRYYLEVVANSRDDYYTGRGEAPGVWLGGGTAALGLFGRVDPEDYLSVMYGQRPDAGGRLLERASSRKTLGWDLTFNAPKGLSLLWALGEAGVGQAIRRAHGEAVAETLAFLENEVARCRRGHGGGVLHDVEGFVAAAFEHRSSRAGDPHLHTHVVVANAVKSVDDHRWTGLDSRGVYAMQAAGGAVYQSALRAKLAALELGWSVRADGLGEVAGIDGALLRAFSTQRTRIEAELAQRGVSSARAAQIAAHRVRPPKDLERASSPDDTLRAQWRSQLEELSVRGRRCRIADVTAALGQDHHGGRTTPLELEEAIDVLSGARDESAAAGRRPLRLLTQRASTLTRPQAIRALATAVDLLPHQMASALDQLLVRPEVVPLLPQHGKGARPEARRYTTADMLAIEADLARLAETRRGEACGLVSAEVVERVLWARPGLGDDQRVALRRLVTSGDGVEVIVGAAGCGKTYLLDAARDAWQRAEYQVVGASLAAIAAAGLETGAGIPSVTVHRLLADLANPDAGGIGARTVLVIDEAAMVGSRTLHALAVCAARAGAKLVLCGDDRQLPEIDAGGGFRLLTRCLEPVTLTDNRRQIHPWERRTLSELRDGRVPEAVSGYTQAGRVTVAPTAEACRQAMIDHWWGLLDRGSDPAQVLLIAATRADADDLGDRAQRRLLATGRLGSPAVTAAHHVLYIGDRVIATRNDWRLGIRNGDRGSIGSATGGRGISVAFDALGERTLPAHYVADHLRLGYGLTAHRAQGLTVEHTLLLGSDSCYRELGYSALSRGHDTNAIYLTDTNVGPYPVNPIDALIQRLTVSRAETPASAALPRHPDLGDAAQAGAAHLERLRLARAMSAHRMTIQDREQLARYRTLDSHLTHRERLLGHAVRWQQPTWARRFLGPLPAGRAAEAKWIAAAGAIAAYRERWDIATDTCPRPNGGMQELDWVALVKKLSQLRLVPPMGHGPTHRGEPDNNLEPHRTAGHSREL
jgi:conjugative relaxase-like TrwC/TraI family protein